MTLRELRCARRTSPPMDRPARPLALLLALALGLPVLPASAQAPADRTPAARRTAAPVTLNFVNAEIEGVARAVGAILNKPIVVDPRVRGTITLFNETPVPPQEAYRNFLAALRGLGFTVVEVAGLLKVVPEADAKLQTGTVAVEDTERRGDQVLTQIFRLQHESAASLVPVLRPLISPNNTINANAGNNTLVVTDYADNLKRLGQIIAALDLPQSAEIEIIPLQHAVAADLAPIVQRLSDGGSSGGQSTPPGVPVPGGSGSSGVSVIADPRGNALLVRAGQRGRMSAVRALVAQLDRPGRSGMAGSGIHVVYLKNADATRLAQVLRAAFSAAGSGSGSSGGAGGVLAALSGGGGTSSSSSGGLGSSGSSSGSSGSSVAAPQTTQPVNAAAAPSTGGFIQADPATNALIITAPEPLYRELRAVIEQLDARRAQVFVETMLVEVNANKAADLGFQFQGLLGGGDNVRVFAGTNFGSGGNNLLNLSIAGATGAVSGTTLPSAGLNAGLLKRYGDVITLGALARFLQTEADGNILSTPNLVTLDNEEAKIVVGQNVPFVTGSFTNGNNGATNPFQTIERRDVGITLRVRPQIGENGTVRMVIYQESSSVVNQNVSQGVADATAGLVTNKRSIESTVVVNDGDILVMGGLMQEQFQDNSSKVPGLGNLPGIGALFRSDNRTRTKSNLMVFLRPVVMRDAEAANALSLGRYDLIRAQQQATQPPQRPGLDVGDAPQLPPLPGTVPAGAAGPASAPAPVEPAR
ncbi:type II secretion system secretin GspD [Piscinibacter sp. Jin2]|uniref:Type II secretion system secretin GspD n=2 Tax=Aquariibacter lacus TaxID=2801332 RepID=A0A9X0XC32_9BURK|nr:type II secretion system secretin GspD [Piscinibacter lacus]